MPVNERKRARGGQHNITFNEAARHEFLTGFHKRKQQRKKEGARQAFEQARKDKMEVKKDYRDHVKQQWKEVQWAERRVQKLLGLEDDEDAVTANVKKRMLQEEHEYEGEKLAALTDGTIQDAGGGSVKVDFSQEDEEDDDPWAGCEVTTTVGVVRDPDTDYLLASGGGGFYGSKLAVFGRGGKGPENEVLSEAQIEARRKIRADNLRKEENIRQASAEKKAWKEKQQAKKDKRKKSRKDKKKTAKNNKTGIKERRRRAKKGR